MKAALTPLFVLAAVVLCAAGATKLRAPAPAVRAALVAGLPARAWLVRALSLVELGIGGWCLLAPARVAAAAMAFLYTSFTMITLVLARRRASCGCFGGGEAPASWLQALLSGALAAAAAMAVLHVPGGLGWLLGRSPVELAVLVIGVAGAAYATVLAYTELPQAWTAWGGR